MGLFNPDTTWVGYFGYGMAGSFGYGRSFIQMDLRHMGGATYPVRVLVQGTRLGPVAEVGTGLCIIIVTGCRSAREMEGLTSSGLDWTLSVGLKAGEVAKTGSRLFRNMMRLAGNMAGDNWATSEVTKKVVQWAMDDLGLNLNGRQFYVIPTPMGGGVGAGIFYEYQTLRLLGGDIGWSYIKPWWSLDRGDGNIYLRMGDIPEQDDADIRVGLYVLRWGRDPLIRWAGGVRGRDYFFRGKVYDGQLYDEGRSMDLSGVNLTRLRPIGLLHEGFFSNSDSDEVARMGRFKVRPVVFGFGNMARWTAVMANEVGTNREGRIRDVRMNNLVLK